MRRFILIGILALSGLLGAEAATAQTYTQRQLITPSGTLDILAGPVPKPIIEDQGILIRDLAGDDDPADLGLSGGLSVGISDDFELGVVPLRLRIFEETDLESPYLWGTYRLVGGETEVGVRGMLPLPIFGGGFWFQLAFPVVAHLSSVTRLETGGVLTVVFNDGVFGNVFVPLRIAVNATSRFFLGLETGLHLPIAQNAPARFPLGLFLGYTLAGPVDLGLAFRWPDFLSFGRDDAFNTRLIALSLGLNARVTF